MNRSGIRHPNEPSITLSYTSRKGMTYKRIPYLLRHPSTSSETFPTPGLSTSSRTFPASPLSSLSLRCVEPVETSKRTPLSPQPSHPTPGLSTSSRTFPAQPIFPEGDATV